MTELERDPRPLVLYVDDESANRIVFQRSFEGRFRIQAVLSAEEALEALEQEVPAVVVSDQRMPGMLLPRTLDEAVQPSNDPAG